MDKIPVIDFGKILTADAQEDDWQEVANKIYEACNGIGFMYIINHGIPNDTVQNAFVESAKFFFLPESEKEQLAFNNVSGYMKTSSELLHPTSKFEPRESFSIVKNSKGGQRFPETLPTFKVAILELEKYCNNLAQKLLTLFAKALRLPDENHFVNSSLGITDAKIPNRTTMRFQWYPPIEKANESDLVIRCGEHTDYGTCTLLFQDSIGGLELKNTEGQWIRATPIPDSVLVNLGDVLEMWTGGRFKATLHRVVVPNEENLRKVARQSITYFVTPDDDYIVSPIPTNAYNGVVIDFDEIKFSEFLDRRLAVSQRDKNY